MTRTAPSRPALVPAPRDRPDGAGAPRARRPVPRPPDFTPWLAPFAAWLAGQGLDRGAAERYRDAVGRFLAWSCGGECGTAGGRRGRYERRLAVDDPDHLPTARAGLTWWAEYRDQLATALAREHRPGPGGG